MHLITYYLNTFLAFFEIGELAVAVVYLVLVANDFKYSEYIYDNFTTKFFKHNEVFLHSFFK